MHRFNVLKYLCTAPGLACCRGQGGGRALKFPAWTGPGGCCTGAKIVLRNTGAALRFAMKILRELATGGVIQSHKGVSGGYELAWEPENIRHLKDDGRCCSHADTMARRHQAGTASGTGPHWGINRHIRGAGSSGVLVYVQEEKTSVMGLYWLP